MSDRNKPQQAEAEQLAPKNRHNVQKAEALVLKIVCHLEPDFPLNTYTVDRHGRTASGLRSLPRKPARWQERSPQ